MTTLAPPRRAAVSVTTPAFVMIAVAIADHAFLRPAPGTSATDHLAAGLIPIAVALTLARWAPRLTPGRRAGVSIVCGALAVTAAAFTLDLTGLLGGLAGAVLIGAGLVEAWTHRDRTGTLRRRVARRAGWSVAWAVLAAFVVLPLGSAILVTHKPRTVAPPVALGAASQPVRLTTSDGLRLHGTYVPSRNRAAVLVFPGRSQTVGIARLLVRHGYGVLLIDPRGQGRSNGEVNRRGWGGRPDIDAALDFLGRRADVTAVGGIGLSVGGEMLLEAAASDDRLRAVVSEGAGIRSLAEQLHHPDAPQGLRWFSPMLVETAAGIVLSGHLPPPDLADEAREIAPRPVLLIRALRGNSDEALNRVYRDAIGPSAQLWELERGGHTDALATDPAEYERRVVGFLDQELKP